MTREFRLNVGGVFFSTSIETLQMGGNTYFERISTQTSPVFVDRDPRHFRTILNFLRDRACALPPDAQSIEEIGREAAFYGIPELQQQAEYVLKLAKASHTNNGTLQLMRKLDSISKALDQL